MVSVVDLARIAGNRLVSAVLRYADPAPGEHDMTLEVGGADQLATTYSGTVTVGDDGMSGYVRRARTAAGRPSRGASCAPPSRWRRRLRRPCAPDAGEEVPESTADVGTG